ncbi:MAG: RNA polymerase sigma factor [Thermoguttaceae bacterium]
MSPQIANNNFSHTISRRASYAANVHNEGEMPMTRIDAETLYYSAIVDYALRLVRNRDVAADIAQETFLRFAQHREEVTHEKAWLYRTARNLVLDYFRRQTHRTARGGDATDSLPDHCTQFCPVTTLERKERDQMLHEQLNTLSPRHREVLRLKFQENLKYAEIAQVTGEPATTVGWLIHEAIEKLRKKMREVELR